MGRALRGILSNESRNHAAAPLRVAHCVAQPPPVVQHKNTPARRSILSHESRNHAAASLRGAHCVAQSPRVVQQETTPLPLTAEKVPKRARAKVLREPGKEWAGPGACLSSSESESEFESESDSEDFLRSVLGLGLQRKKKNNNYEASPEPIAANLPLSQSSFEALPDFAISSEEESAPATATAPATDLSEAEDSSPSHDSGSYYGNDGQGQNDDDDDTLAPTDPVSRPSSGHAVVEPTEHKPFQDETPDGDGALVPTRLCQAAVRLWEKETFKAFPRFMRGELTQTEFTQALVTSWTIAVKAIKDEDSPFDTVVMEILEPAGVLVNDLWMHAGLSLQFVLITKYQALVVFVQAASELCHGSN